MCEPDYTEIRDDKIRGKICELMSEMLDNPDEHGIFPTSRFMWKMETFILAASGAVFSYAHRLGEEMEAAMEAAVERNPLLTQEQIAKEEEALWGSEGEEE